MFVDFGLRSRVLCVLGSMVVLAEFRGGIRRLCLILDQRERSRGLERDGLRLGFGSQVFKVCEI